MSRLCSCCGKEIHEGFVIQDGLEYYCSEECLTKHHTWIEYSEMFDVEEAYWTTWEEDDEDDIPEGQMSIFDEE